MIDQYTRKTLEGLDIDELLAKYAGIKADDARFYAENLRHSEAGRRTVEYIPSKDIPSKFKGNSTLTIRGLNRVTVLEGVNSHYAPRLTQIYAEQPENEFYGDATQLSIARLQRLESQDLLISDDQRRRSIQTRQSKKQLEAVA